MAMAFAKVRCLQVLEQSSYVLTKTGVLLLTDKLRSLDICKIIFNFSYVIFVEILILLNIKLAITTNNMGLVNWMICVLIPVLYYTAKGLTLFVNRKCVLSLLDDLNSYAFNEHCKKLNRHIQTIKTASNMALKCFGFAVITLVFITCVLPFVIPMKLMIPAPFDTGRFEILYKLFHLVSITYFATNAVCFDIFYMSLMGLAVAQLNILAARVINATESSRDLKAKVSTQGDLSTIVTQILKECFVLHQMIIGFIDKLSVLGSFPLFVQYTCGCFTICNTIARLTIMGETDISSIISGTSYFCVIFTEMAAYHWIANEITYKSAKIIEACYLSVWYELSTESQKSLLLLMERARKPSIIQLYGFVDVSLASLAVVVRWSYSIFAVIKARYN